MIRKVLYIILVLLGLIPATLAWFSYVILGLYMWSAAVSHPEDFKEPVVVVFTIAIVLWFLSGLGGYFGFLSLLRGLRKKWYRINLVLLSLGVLHNIFFWMYMEKHIRGVFDTLESTVTLFIGLLPVSMSVVFIIWILIRMNKEKDERAFL